MRVRLLGPVDIVVDTGRMAVGGPQAQAVLALLAVHAGEVVSADRLIDELWGGRPPRAARVTVQSHISRLRALHEPDTVRMLPRQRHGYLLDPAASEVDAHRYVELAGRGCGEVRDSRWAAGRETLGEAAGMWRGTPFSGIDDVPTLTAERARLEALRLDARFAELHAALQIDGPTDVIAPLRRLVDARPWDETGWRLLVLAYYRAGRQSEALEASARARRMLAEEQGLDPSPELADLERRTRARPLAGACRAAPAARQAPTAARLSGRP